MEKHQHIESIYGIAGYALIKSFLFSLVKNDALTKAQLTEIIETARITTQDVSSPSDPDVLQLADELLKNLDSSVSSL